MTRLHSIAISNFRGIQQGRLEKLGDVNILIGPNNSGKTTIGEAITFATQHLGVQCIDPLGRSGFKIYSETRDASASELWYRNLHANPISCELSLGSDDNSNTEPDRRYKLVYRATGQHERPNLSDSDAKFLRSTTVFRPPDAANHTIEQSLWLRCLSDRRDRTLNEQLNTIFNLEAESFQMVVYKLVCVFPEYSVPLDLQGDGTRAALRCLMMISALESTLFILEEPECHQHPGSLRRFGKALCAQAHAQSVQLLISTHSAECMRAILNGAQSIGADSAVFHLSLREGLLETRRFEVDAAQSLEAQGIDLRFLNLYV